ncbi:hypothetical protein AB0L53_09670 [Nonomuraea sp. NPDC052129]|uniref:hypothetical protein n=1 Tax=Nonomuraea sp. NPDC052129 TaxID=3154651 RepID=UPI003417EB3D
MPQRETTVRFECRTSGLRRHTGRCRVTGAAAGTSAQVTDIGVYADDRLWG